MNNLINYDWINIVSVATFTKQYYIRNWYSSNMRKIFIFSISMTGEFKTVINTRGYSGTTSSLSLTNLYLIYIIPPSSSILLFTSYCFSLSSFLSHSLTVFYHFPLSFPHSNSLTDILYTH